MKSKFVNSNRTIAKTAKRFATESARAAILCALLPAGAGASTYSKVETIEYHDDLSLWVLGQVKRTTTDGIETSRTEYGWKANPWKVYAFGKLQQTITYSTVDGTVSSVTDGNGNRTEMAAWKRGIPGLITYADGTRQQAVVSERGWITAVVDQNNFTTNYSHDAMGRLTRIDYPAGGGWLPTVLKFERVTVTEYGIAPNHWRQTSDTGTARKITYYDGLWRPLLTREWDTADSSTQRFQRFAYDPEGRPSFVSYPGTTASLTSGTFSFYDSLGRVESVSQDSETQPLVTLTEYLPGLRTRVTIPGGQQTVTAYQAYDQPTYDFPILIDAPEAMRTQITRDVFGKPLEIKRLASP